MAHKRINKGYGAAASPGSVPQVKWEPGVWLIRSSDQDETNSEKKIVAETRNVIRNLGMAWTELKAQTLRDPDGFGSISYLRPVDVRRLYFELHNKRLVVLSFRGHRVQKDVSERWSRRGSVPLESFIDGKGYFSLISRPTLIQQALVEGLKWSAGIHCPSHRDEKCLPWHVFDGGETRSSVSRDKKGSFVDSKTRIWEAGPCHTVDILQVAGCTLPVGYHWDVQSRSDSIILNGWETWRVPGGGYANVHPNAYIRGQKLTKIADAIKSSEGSQGGPRNPKTPARKRRK